MRWQLGLTADSVQAQGVILKNWARAKAMTRYENRTFENDHVVLDEGVFVNCIFKNCSLEYSGGDVYVQTCQGENCQLVWRGAAQRTISLLQGLGLLAPAASLPPTEPSERVQ